MSDSCDSKKIEALEKRVADLEKRLAAEQEVASLQDRISEVIRSSLQRFQ